MTAKIVILYLDQSKEGRWAGVEHISSICVCVCFCISVQGSSLLAIHAMPTISSIVTCITSFSLISHPSFVHTHTHTHTHNTHTHTHTHNTHTYTHVHTHNTHVHTHNTHIHTHTQHTHTCTHTTHTHTHSVFIRDCKGCRCLIACQQFRMRDCHRLEVFLHCQSQPVTENATAIKFGCFQGGYDGLVAQCEASKLSPFLNQWAQVHDFTPVPDTDNWTLFPAEVGRWGLHCCT